MKKRAMIKSIVFMEASILISFGMLMIGIYLFNYILIGIGVCLFPMMLLSIFKYEKIMEEKEYDI